MRGLITGRFQPFHKGHLSVVMEVLGKCDELVIVIGSAEESHTARNPLTASERFQMILSSLAPDELARVHIIPVRDINRYALWVEHVESYVPPFDIVYSNNDLTRSLFSDAGYVVEKTKAYGPGKHSGAEIRRRITEGAKWKHLVPEPVVSIIESLELRQRLLDSGACSSRDGGADGAR
ncbi:MAG TPA: nicotinamide-nucleotide adenylyltransferase [Thermoplasmata archaeon]|nr:nicotinamide-nucleotide adenylyltransferase [Thermoplasmata archaeon]